MQSNSRWKWRFNSEAHTRRPYSFYLEKDTSGFGAYEKGGIVTQIKQLKVLKFKLLKESLKERSEFLLTDFSKFDRPPLLSSKIYVHFQNVFPNACETLLVSAKSALFRSEQETATSLHPFLKDFEFAESTKKNPHTIRGINSSTINLETVSWDGNPPPPLYKHVPLVLSSETRCIWSQAPRT